MAFLFLFLFFKTKNNRVSILLLKITFKFFLMSQFFKQILEIIILLR